MLLHEITATREAEYEVQTTAELRAALPVVPENPSRWKVELEGKAIKITYGSPDQHHAEVAVFTDRVLRETFDAFSTATARFLELIKQG